MQITISTRPFELYFCNGHYNVRQDELDRNGFTIRFGQTVYNKGTGWRRLHMKLFEAQNIKIPTTPTA